MLVRQHTVQLKLTIHLNQRDETKLKNTKKNNAGGTTHSPTKTTNAITPAGRKGNFAMKNHTNASESDSGTESGANKKT